MSQNSVPSRTNHPELKPGELLLCNSDGYEDFQALDYQTKRLGQVAYDADGNQMHGLFPVFIWKSEYEDRTNAL